MLSYSKLEDILEERGITARKLCEEAHISSKTYYRMIRGDRASISNIERICLYLHVGVRDIVETGSDYDMGVIKHILPRSDVNKLSETIKDIRSAIGETEDATDRILKMFNAEDPHVGYLIKGVEKKREELEQKMSYAEKTLEEIKEKTAVNVGTSYGFGDAASGT